MFNDATRLLVASFRRKFRKPCARAIAAPNWHNPDRQQPWEIDPEVADTDDTILGIDRIVGCMSDMTRALNRNGTLPPSAPTIHRAGDLRKVPGTGRSAPTIPAS